MSTPTAYGTVFQVCAAYTIVAVINITSTILHKEEHVGYETRIRPFDGGVYTAMRVVSLEDMEKTGVDPSVFTAEAGDAVDVGTSAGTVYRNGAPGVHTAIIYERKYERRTA